MSQTQALVFVGLTLAGFILSALFSGLETGVYTINRVRLTVRAARGEPTAVRLRRELRRSNRTLVVLLIGTNATNYLASFALTELLHGAGFSDWALVALGAALFTPLLFIFAETLPKDLFRTHTDRWTYWLTPFIIAVRWLFTVTLLLPCVQLFSWMVSRLAGVDDRGAVTAQQRISQLIKEGVGPGVVSETQTTLADRALAVRHRTVADEMVPWANVITLSADADRATRETLIRRRNFTRLPVLDRSGRPIGVLSLLDAVLQPERTTRQLMTQPLVFDPRTPIREALRPMQRGRKTLGIVVDPRTRRPLGIVTIKDLVEPLTGELAAW